MTTTQGVSTDVESIVTDAIRHHQAGRLNEAERLYRQITIFEAALAGQMTDSHTELTQLKATRAWRAVSRFWPCSLAR